MDDDRQAFHDMQRTYVSQLSSDAALKADALDLLDRADSLGHPYVWNWLGVPIIQSPEDVFVLQELIWETRPDFVIETGVARGGSVVLYASILELIGHGQVIGVDIDIRPHNRNSIESHPMSKRITLVEGSSTSQDVIDRIKSLTSGSERVSVVLDSNHTHEHVLEELSVYAPMVGVGQFMLVADTIVEYVPAQTHRVREWGPGNNPATALANFLSTDSDFELDQVTNGKLLLTYSPGGFLRRKSR